MSTQYFPGEGPDPGRQGQAVENTCWRKSLMGDAPVYCGGAVGRRVHPLGSGDDVGCVGQAGLQGAAECRAWVDSFLLRTSVAVGSSVGVEAQALRLTALAWNLAISAHQHHLLYHLQHLPPSLKG